MAESDSHNSLSKTNAFLRAETLGCPNALWGILGLALVLRVIEITEDSIWIDEAFAIMTARLDVASLMQKISGDALTPPLHYLILSVWMDLFGESELAARSLSMVLGVVSVWLIYTLAETLVGRRVALISAFILAVSSFHVHYAQEARTYTLLLCLSIASYLFFYKWLQHNARRDAVVYVLMSSLMIYAHFFGLFVVLAQNVHFSILLALREEEARRRFWVWCVLQVALILSVLPLAILLAGGLQRVNEGVWIANAFPPNLQSILELLSAFSGSPAGLAFYGLLFGWTLFIWAQDRPNWADIKGQLVSPVGLLLGWLIVGVSAPFVISIIAQPILFPRYVIYASVPFFVLLAFAIDRFHGKQPAYMGLIALVAVFGAIQMAGFYLWNWNHFRFLRDWRSAEQYVDQMAEPRDLVLCTGNCQGLTYYLRDSDLAFRLSPSQLGNSQTREASSDQFLSDLKAYERVFYVRPRRISQAEAVTAALQQEFTPGDREKVKGLFIDVFERTKVRE